jgi:murE/murF fusion protein
LRGETFDGHDYLEQVAQAGAVAAIVDGANVAVALPQVVLGDTRAALLQLGRAWRRQFAIPVVAVAGSNGKTTTKEMVAAIFAAWKGEPHRLATAGNLNNELGVPLTLLRLNDAHQAAVIEMGMNHPGEMALLGRATEPTVALVNNAQREHQEFMVSVHAVAQENAQVFAHLTPDGVAVYPADDSFSKLWDQMSGQHEKLRFGFSRDAEVWADQICSDVLGSSFELHTPQGQAQVALPVPGLHNVRNALAAAACTLAAGAPLADVVRGLAGFHAVSGRMQPHRLPGSVVLIDDTYNANPDSVRAAIDVLTALPAPRVLVLGDMGEVGDHGPEMHREVGAYAKQKGIEILLTLGQATRESARAFGAQAMAFDEIEALQSELEKIDAKSLLIKGSRFMRMERVVRGCLTRFGMNPGEVVAHAV